MLMSAGYPNDGCTLFCVLMHKGSSCRNGDDLSGVFITVLTSTETCAAREKISRLCSEESDSEDSDYDGVSEG